ncbi:MAG TPA: ribosome small subunit-dependent GTPase A [Bacteroidales bacterium]
MSINQKGKVVRATGIYYSVITEAGNVVECTLKGVFRIKGLRTTNPIAVGDEVVVQVENNSGVILEIGPRKNYIIRKSTNLSKETHMIAANMDQAVLIVSLIKPRTSTGFIDRFLVTAEAYHIPAIIVFNKVDLYDEKSLENLDYYLNTYRNCGYKCLVTSVPEKVELQAFGNMLAGKVSLLSGHSGVGKSALINAIDPELNLKEGIISDYHEKGKHTTTFAEMFKLKNNGFIIDTPGIKEFGLVEFEKTELGQRFPEIRERMHDCRFNNCLHTGEPGCAVIQAFEKGEISDFRYQNYINMLNDL